MMPKFSPTSYRSRIVATALVALGLSMPAAAMAQAVPTVFQQVPVKADAYILIPKLSGLSQKLAILNESLNLNQPPLADAITEFKRQFAISNGLNEDGSFLIIFMNGLPLSGNSAATEKDTLVLIPVNDYAAFVGGYRGTANELVTALTLPNDRKGFARRVGTFALLGSDRKTLEEYKPTDLSAGLQALAGPLGLKCLGDSDISLITIGKAARLADSPNGNGDLSNPTNPDQTISISGIDVSELGIGLSAVGKYRDGSVSAKYFSAGQPSAKILGKLPPDPAYAVGTGFTTQGINLVDILKHQIDLMGRAGSPNVEFARKAATLAENLKAASVLLTPVSQQSFNGSFFNATIVIETANPKAYIANFKDYLDSLKTASLVLNADQSGEVNTLKFTSRYTPNALQVDGFSVDQYEVNYIIPSSTLKQLADARLLGLGTGGQNGYITATQNHVLITTTADAEVIRQALASVRANSGLGTDPLIAEVRYLLPPSPVAEAYVSGSSLVNGLNFIRATKNLAAVEPPANMPPIGFGISVEPGGWMAKTYIPMPLALEIYNDLLPVAIPGAKPAPRTTIAAKSIINPNRRIATQDDPNATANTALDSKILKKNMSTTKPSGGVAPAAKPADKNAPAAVAGDG